MPATTPRTRRDSQHRTTPSLMRRFRDASALLAGIVALSLTAVTGTFAYLNATATAGSAATITAGTASLTASSVAGSFTNLYPGAAKTATFTVTNTGDVDLELILDQVSVANATSLAVTVGAHDCTGMVAAGNALNITVPAGSSATLCVRAAMSTNAPAADRDKDNISINIALTGSQT